jgi:hypothetical protein
MHDWDNPGRPGKGRWQLVPPSPSVRVSALIGRYHQLLWPESCPVSSSTNQELSGKARSETASKPSQAHGPFRPVRRHSYPRGLWLLLCRPERSRVSRRANPRQKAPPAYASGARKGDSAAGSERARQSPSTSSMGQREKARRHTAKANAT